MKKKFCTLAAAILLSSALFAEPPLVKDIEAHTSLGTKINITWTIPEDTDKTITKFYLYRTTKPITSYSQLKDINPLTILRAETHFYTDSLKDYNEYFYSIVAVTDKPYEVILPAMNSTIVGVHLTPPKNKAEKSEEKEEKLYTDGSLRETPLPYLDMLEKDGEFEVISEKAVKTASEFSLSEKDIFADNISPYIFEEDLISPIGGDEYLLFNILKSSFIRKEYTEAINGLSKLLGTRISDKVRNRAYFYTAESYYFTGNYEEAVKYFVKLEQIYPELAKKWINLSLDKISIR
ncbi:MAG: tetratricopeptide repeat protein [Treponema sp.]|nr:tetratricopeptide repeat protein [Treponema sp.]